MNTIKKLLIKFDACKDAIEWAGDKPIEEIVKTCHRGDWLLWLARRIDIPLKAFILAKGHSAKTVLHLMDDERSKKAVEVAILFGEGKATREELDTAHDAAYLAYDAAYAAYYAAASASASAASYAAHAAAYYAAVYAAYAASAASAYYASDSSDTYASATYAAHASAYYASSAAAATAAADASAARTKNEMETADIGRKYIGQLIVNKVNDLCQ